MPVCGAVVALAVCKLGRPQIVLNCLGKINARGIERGCSLGKNKDKIKGDSPDAETVVVFAASPARCVELIRMSYK